MARSKKYKDTPNGICGVLFGPNSDWTPPSTFPNLDGVKRISFDVESKDPNLEDRGPGFIRGDAKVIGFSIATHDMAWYFPFDHLSGGNLDQDACKAYVTDLAKRKDIEIVGANLQYELEAIWGLTGETIQGKLLDIQVAEALLDEESLRGYSLEVLSRKYLGEGKDETLLREAATAHGVDPKKGLWKLHSKYVGPYAERDAVNPLRIFEKQYAKLAEENLTSIFNLETKLLPILWLMRLQGIPVDLHLAENLSHDLAGKETEYRNGLFKLAGYHVDVWSGMELARLCDKLQITYGRTPAGNPSFTKEFLEEADNPVLQLIRDIREVNRLRTTFVDDWIFGNELDGRIHPQWKQLVSDEGGARTGRMAAANPNPQQVPSRSELAYLVRRIFRRQDGLWGKNDYSQQEPRILTHYAYLKKFAGAKEVRDAYCNDKKMDIYRLLASAASIERKQSKDITLGRCYGMGIKRLAQKLNITRQEAERLLKQFDTSVPFVSLMSNDVAAIAAKRGWIRTILGRKRHFNYWEPVNKFEIDTVKQATNEGPDTIPVGTIEEAAIKWPNTSYKRAWTHKALNSLIQGSAADQTKLAIVLGYEMQQRVPYMVVHDELDGPVADQADGEKWKELCETCMPMEVPSLVELSVGESWK